MHHIDNKSQEWKHLPPYRNQFKTTVPKSIFKEYSTANRRFYKIATHKYPFSYKVKDIAEQVAILKSLLLELKDATYDKTIADKPVSGGAEGWFAIPRQEKFWSSYHEAITRLIAVMKSENGLVNCINGWTGPEYLRQHLQTIKAFQKLGDEQNGHNILIVPCQFGLYHRGRSFHLAREIMNDGEFGLGAFAVGCMLLTHPDRLQNYDDLWIHCVGDEYSFRADTQFMHTLSFICSDDRVNYSDLNNNEHYGFASGFLITK